LSKFCEVCNCLESKKPGYRFCEEHLVEKRAEIKAEIEEKRMERIIMQSDYESLPWWTRFTNFCNCVIISLLILVGLPGAGLYMIATEFSTKSLYTVIAVVFLLVCFYKIGEKNPASRFH